MLAPEEAAAVRRFDAEVLEGGGPTRREERLEGRDAYAWSMVIRFPVRDAAGRIVRIGGFDLDITAQKRALAKLAASERRLREIVRGHPVPMSITRLADRRLLYANRAFLAAFGLTPEERRRLRPRPALRRPGGAPRAAREAGARGRGRGPRDPPAAGRRDAVPGGADRALVGYEGGALLGRELPRPHRAEGGRGRDRAPARGAAPEREADGARLAARRGRARAQQPALGRGRPRRSCSRSGARPGGHRVAGAEMREAAERCARIVKTFLAMARQQPPRARARSTLGRGARARARARRLRPAHRGRRGRASTLAPDLPPVWGDADQLHQVLLNLLVNAQQALAQVPAPRRLVVRARRAGRRRSWSRSRTTARACRRRSASAIFEPFFTTKPQGVGTGIGLSVCHGIVAAHGGRIEVDDRAGRAARCSASRCRRRRAEPPAVEAAAADAAAARGRVLVVDDERGIAELVAVALRRDGLEVETATSGRAALARLARGGIDLVMSDVRMPDLDGAGADRGPAGGPPRRWPRRLILITGDVLGAQTSEAVRASGLPVLEKPLDIAALRREVRRLLVAGGDRRGRGSEMPQPTPRRPGPSDAEPGDARPSRAGGAPMSRTPRSSSSTTSPSSAACCRTTSRCTASRCARPADGAELDQRLAEAPADLLILDVNMPDEGGFAIARRLRAAGSRVGILMLTAAGDLEHRLEGLGGGADDYLAKPVELRELLARARSVLRRVEAEPAAPPPRRRCRFGRCTLDLDARRMVDETGAEVPLTAMEYDLLAAFAAHPREVLSRERLAGLAHDRPLEPRATAASTSASPACGSGSSPTRPNPVTIRTVRGEGYVFEPEA